MPEPNRGAARFRVVRPIDAVEDGVLDGCGLVDRRVGRGVRADPVIRSRGRRRHRDEHHLVALERLWSFRCVLSRGLFGTPGDGEPGGVDGVGFGRGVWNSNRRGVDLGERLVVVPEPAAGAREGRVDAPGRGEGEGGVASEISREKFLGT